MTGTAARNEVYVSFFEAPVGVGAVVAGRRGLREVFLPFRVATREDMAATVRSRYPRLAGENSLGREAARQLVAYFAGEAVGFALYFFPFSTFRGQPSLYLEDLFGRDVDLVLENSLNPALRERILPDCLTIDLA